MALSLKEMSDVPGGAFRTFWEPVYKTSMPVGRGDTGSRGAKDGVTPAGVSLQPRTQQIKHKFWVTWGPTMQLV